MFLENKKIHETNQTTTMPQNKPQKQLPKAKPAGLIELPISKFETKAFKRYNFDPFSFFFFFFSNPPKRHFKMKVLFI